MAECKNCISENVCKYKDETVSLGIAIKETMHDCKDFKNKADFRKVTRCESCKYKETCEQYLYIDSNRTELVYCSYGERRDT